VYCDSVAFTKKKLKYKHEETHKEKETKGDIPGDRQTHFIP